MDKSTSTDNASRLTSGKLLARNTIFNLLGHIVPLSIAFFAYPILIKSLGTARFGVLTLIWVVVGYFNLFDLGLGRALTKLVAERLAKVKAGEIDKEISPLIWTCVLVMFFLGVVAAAVLIIMTPWLVSNLFRKIPDIYKPETLKAFFVLGLSFPFVISTTSLRGILEALQRFDVINIIRSFNGTYTFLGPIIALQFSPNLYSIAVALTLGRIVFWIIYFFFCMYTLPQLRHGVQIQLSFLSPLFKLGGWMTVSSVVAPIIAYIDRFFILKWVSAEAVAYYVTPYEVVTKLLILPNAVIKVLFPAFATSFAQDPDSVLKLYNRSIKYIFIVVFPAILLVMTFAYIGLKLWINEELARNSTIVMQWMAIGVLTNSLAQVAYVAIQALGRPDLTAKVHFYQAVPYLTIYWFMVKYYGLQGAAIIWTARVVAEAIILFYFVNRLMNSNLSIRERSDLLLLPAAIVLSFAMLTNNFVVNLIYCIIILVSFIFVTWFYLLDTEEHKVSLNYLSKIKLMIRGE